MTSIQRDTKQIPSADMSDTSHDTKPMASAQPASLSSSDAAKTIRAHSSARDATNNVSMDQTNTDGQQVSFTDSLDAYQDKLNDDFQDYKRDIEKSDHDIELPDLEWDDLEAEYEKDVGSIAMKEREIMTQFDERFKVSLLQYLLQLD